MKERFINELKKMKAMPFNQLMSYIWDYYKWSIIVTLCVLIFFIALLRGILSNNPGALKIMACNMLPSMTTSEEEAQVEETINQDYLNYTGKTAGSKPYIEMDHSADLLIEDSYTASVMTQKVTASIGAQLVDILAGPEESILHYAQLNIYEDVRDYLPEETVSALEDQGLICKATISPDTESGEDFEPYEVWYGIKADGMTTLTEAGYDTEGIVIGIVSGTEKHDMAVEVMNMLIDDLL